MMLFRQPSGSIVQSSLFTGSWGTAVSIDSLPSNSYTSDAVTDYSDADKVNYVYSDSSGASDLWYLRYNSGWGVRENVANNTGTSRPMISVNSDDDSVVVS